MPRKTTTLRAVADGEGAPKARKRARTKTVKSAADSGDRRELLVSLRARIAKDIDDPNTPSRDLAALSRRLLEIAKEIEAIDSRDGEDDIGTAARTPNVKFDADAI